MRGLLIVFIMHMAVVVPAAPIYSLKDLNRLQVALRQADLKSRFTLL